MIRTEHLDESTAQRLLEDPLFAEELLREGLQALVDGEIEMGKSLICDCIEATVGFDNVANDINESPASVRHMFSADGNPNIDNLFDVIVNLQKHGGLSLEVSTQAH